MPLKIISHKPIYKIGERVFKYGNFSHDKTFLNTIVAILDLGFKFVSNVFKNDYEFFNYILHKIDSHTLEINKYLFYNRINQNNRSNHNGTTRNVRVSFNEENISQTNS